MREQFIDVTVQITITNFRYSTMLSFGLLHIGLLGSILVTVSIATDRYITVCYPTSIFTRKYLLIVVPILISLTYNIPKFFEIVSCSKEEMYGTMIKALLKSRPTTNETDRHSTQEIHRTDSAITQSLPFSEYHKASQKDTVLHDNQNNHEMLQSLLHFVTTTDHQSVTNAMKNNNTPCDLYGHRMADFRSNGWYIIIYQFFSDLVLVKLIPWFAVIILNVKVVIASRKFRQRRLQLLNKTEDARGNGMTKLIHLLMFISILFFIMP